MSYKIPFYQATFPDRLKTISSSNFENLKEANINLEESFKNITNSKFALSVNNPSSAIHLSLCAIDLKRGDKVICAVNSYVDIPEAIRHFDSEPIFTDIKEKKYTIDFASFKNALEKNRSKKLRAVIFSHFAGLKEDITPFIELAKKNNLIVIEDFTDAAVDNSIKIQGDIAIFSLNYKLDNNLKGAMLVFKDEKFFNRAKLLREHGLISTNQDVSYLYDIVDIGCDYRLDSLSAYLLDGLLTQREKLITKKREIANIYFKELEGVEHITLPIKDKKHQYSYFVIEVDKNRDAFARELKALGVEVALHYIPLNFTKYYKEKYGLKIFSFPNALSSYQKIMSLPCHSKMSKKDALYVCEAVKKVASKHIWV